MRYKRNQEVVYRNGFELSLAVLVITVWLLGALSAFLSWGEDALFFPALGFLIVPWVGVGLVRPRVVLRESDVQVHGSLFTETIEYDSISAALFTGELLGRRYLEIHRRWGGSVGVLPLHSQVPFVDPFWQRPLAVEIIERVEEARSHAHGE